MRVTGGTARGRAVQAPDGLDVRPTASKVRQAFFNIVGNNLNGITFLDLFAGSGLMGIEAASRGASSVIFVEESRKMARAIRENLFCLGFEAEVICNDVRRVLPVLEPESIDIIFADPPYKSDLGSTLLHLVDRYRLLSGEGLLVIEHMKGSMSARQVPPGLVHADSRHYGQTTLDFFRRSRDSGQGLDCPDL